jgi:hypothetical protein
VLVRILGGAWVHSGVEAQYGWRDERVREAVSWLLVVEYTMVGDVKGFRWMQCSMVPMRSGEGEDVLCDSVGMLNYVLAGFSCGILIAITNLVGKVYWPRGNSEAASHPSTLCNASFLSFSIPIIPYA